MSEENEAMTGLEAIATQAVLSIASATTTELAGKVSSWIKRKLSADAAKAVDAVAQNPKSKGPKLRLEGTLLTEMEQNPALAKELADLLKEAGTTYADQTAKASDGSGIVQAQGKGNFIKVSTGSQ